jgi:hypothetical protein
MGVRRVATLGIAGLLVVAGAACSPAREAVPAPPGADDRARDALVAAYGRSLAVAHTVESQSAGRTSRAVLDPATESGLLTLREVLADGTALTAETRRIADDTWIQATGFGTVDADTWIHVDSERTVGSVLAVDTSEMTEGFTRSLLEVRGAVPLYSGTLLLPGTRGAQFGHAEAASLAPFTATVDDRGRVTSLTIEANSMIGLDAVRTTISGFEAPVSVAAPPAAEVVEGTDEMLATFGIN